MLMRKKLLVVRTQLSLHFTFYDFGYKTLNFYCVSAAAAAAILAANKQSPSSIAIS